jgi:hypothetical protein
MKNAVYWDVTSFGSCYNQRFGGTYLVVLHGTKSMKTFLTPP